MEPLLPPQTRQQMRIDRLAAVEKEVAALKERGEWTGYDENVYRVWLADGAPGTPPRWSVELRQRERSQIEQRAREREIERYELKLREMAQLQEAERESSLRREYPISYPAWKAAWTQELLERGREQQRRRQEEENAKARMEQHRRQITRKMIDYLYGDEGMDSISSAEYMEWCSEYASERDLEILDQRLKQDAERLKREGTLSGRLLEWLGLG